MNKSDLKDGMIVKFKGFENLGIVLGKSIQGKFINEDYMFIDLAFYTEDLRSSDNQLKFDIIEIYEVDFNKTINILYALESKTFNNMKLLWKREKEEVTYKEMMESIDEICDKNYKKNKTCCGCIAFNSNGTCNRSVIADDSFTITRK